MLIEIITHKVAKVCLCVYICIFIIGISPLFTFPPIKLQPRKLINVRIPKQKLDPKNPNPEIII